MDGWTLFIGMAVSYVCGACTGYMYGWFAGWAGCKKASGGKS